MIPSSFELKSLVAVVLDVCVCVCGESFLWVHHCAGQVSEHTWVGFKLLRTIYSKTETDIQLQNKDNKSEQKEVKIHQKSHCDRHDDQLHTQSLSLRERNIYIFTFRLCGSWSTSG